MKKLLGLLLLVFVFSGCQVAYEIIDEVNYNKYDKFELYNYDYSEIDSIAEISIWIRERVTYKTESGDHWQSPEETLTLGTGDCEDFALLFINIAHIVFGQDWNLVCVNSDDIRTVVAGGKIDHAMVEKDNIVVEPQTGIVTDITIRYRYTYNELFN